jgi:hypothetical protein
MSNPTREFLLAMQQIDQNSDGAKLLQFLFVNDSTSTTTCILIPCMDILQSKVVCFATTEYISLFERRHQEAARLSRNVCFRPATDTSPKRPLVDGPGLSRWSRQRKYGAPVPVVWDATYPTTLSTPVHGALSSQGDSIRLLRARFRCFAMFEQ